MGIVYHQNPEIEGKASRMAAWMRVRGIGKKIGPEGLKIFSLWFVQGGKNLSRLSRESGISRKTLQLWLDEVKENYNEKEAAEATGEPLTKAEKETILAGAIRDADNPRDLAVLVGEHNKMTGDHAPKQQVTLNVHMNIGPDADIDLAKRIQAHQEALAKIPLPPKVREQLHSPYNPAQLVPVCDDDSEEEGNPTPEGAT